MTTWATDRLDALISSTETQLPPVIQTLGLGSLESWEPGFARKQWTSQPHLLNGDGTVFGGYIAALADQALAFAAMTVLPGDSVFRTINLSVSFVRVAKAGTLTIDARVTAQTKRIITTRAEFHREDGALVAEASAQQVVQVVSASR